ncbi:MAG: elongation factor G [Candidatus Zixiibacteriota bacterium]|nr:MAG: elongation factor G [candidate division Zixibacteria bacterium]
MKEYTTDKIHNVCFAGQRGCGKTQLADTIAFNTKINNRIGHVDDGSSILDYNPDEISRKTTISAKLLACEWGKGKINVLDCPGHTDFIGELQGCLKVSEAVGVVISANAGVEIGTQIHFKEIDKIGKPRFFFVNKMGAENVKWQSCLTSIKDTFGKNAVAVQLPIGEAQGFKGIVDLLKMKAYTFDGGKRTETEIPADLKDQADAAREALVEVAAETDDALMEKYFDAGTLDDAEILKGLKAGITAATAYPILVGSAYNNIGVQLLLDFITEYLPTPDMMPAVQALKPGQEKPVELPVNTSGKPVGFVFKTVSEGHLGEMVFTKLFSGSIKTGNELKNQQTGSSERINQINVFQGKNRAEVPSIVAGDIGVFVKLKDTHTGNTLAGGGAAITVPPVDFTNPVMDVAIKAKSKGDEEKISNGFAKLKEEDPTFRLVSDPALKQQVLYGQGPTHIDVLVERLKTRYGVEVELVKPKIPYRETVRGKAEKQYRHKKQSGGRGQYGDVYLRIEPNKRGSGFEFKDEIKGGVIPSKYIPAVEKGILEAMQNGGLAGSQVVDIKVALYFGSYHDVDSSDMAFKIAGLMAFKEGFMEAKPVILEPIYNVEITVPDDFTGDVMGDISSRRGKIAGMDPDGKNQTIRASVPQAELYQYSVDLRSMTQGQGVYTLNFSHYEEVPHDVAQKIMEEARREKEQEG